MIELIILGFLNEETLHGYELKHRAENLIGFFGKVSYGSLYPMLRKLTERDQVRKVQGEQEDQRRIPYQITSDGKARFQELMQDSNISFALRMLFFQNITTSDRSRIMELQRDEWSRKLVERQCNQDNIGNHSTNHYQAALLARSIRRLEQDITWVQELMAEERS